MNPLKKKMNKERRTKVPTKPRANQIRSPDPQVEKRWAKACGWIKRVYVTMVVSWMEPKLLMKMFTLDSTGMPEKQEHN